MSLQPLRESDSSLRPKTVWIVEDNVAYRSSLAHLLKTIPATDCGLVASSAEEAVEKIDDPNRPDIVLMDLSMPGMSGIEGTRHIKDRSPDTHIIALTVQDDEQHVTEAFLAGASGYLLKPSSRREISDAMDAVLEGGSPITPQIASIVLKFFKQYVPGGEDHGLSKTEFVVLQHLADGKTKKEIADTLVKSEHTVDTHIRRIYKKLDVHSRASAINKAVRNGLIRTSIPTD